MNEQLVKDLKSAAAQVRLNEPLSKHVTFGAGGPADIFAIAETEEQLLKSWLAARKHGEPVFIFGSGSNILVGDRGIRGVTIENRTSQVDGPHQNGAGFRVRVASGVSFAALARRMAMTGYGGIEWACGIPGSLGGAVVYNAGAYGSSLQDVLKSARVADAGGEIAELSAKDLQLAYRNSVFTRGEAQDRLVLSVDLRLEKGDPKPLVDRIHELDAHRRMAQPPGRNCGSVFKNPAENPAWWYVDQVGLRGHRIGNAQFSEQHTNFIMNLGGATAKDITALIELAQQRVRDQFGVELETEVALVGEFA